MESLIKGRTKQKVGIIASCMFQLQKSVFIGKKIIYNCCL